MTDKVIIGTPFICLLYPFTTTNHGITTQAFGQTVTFKFLSSSEIKELNQLKEYSMSQSINRITKQLKSLKE